MNTTMNTTMNTLGLLTHRELEIAELLAWGASKKEIPSLLPIKPGKAPISIYTVENTTRNIFTKLQIQKVNELSAIYFCSRFNISMELSPLKRNILIVILAALLLPQIFSSPDMRRPQRSASRTATRAVRAARARGREYDLTNTLSGLHLIS